MLGGKAASLLALREAGLPIPEWFAVTPKAFDASVAAGDDAASAQPSAEIAAAIAAAVRRLGGDEDRFAVRSSAVDEDGAQHSFAGQLESYLFVRPDEIAARVADVWRSGFTERIVAYRRERGLSGPPQPPAVLVQRMVDAESAGVAFSVDPTSGRRDRCVVAAVYGLGTALVGGDADSDTFSVDHSGAIVERTIATKEIAHCIGGDGVSGVMSVQVPREMADQPAIKDKDVVRVANLARAAAAYFGRAQDIEWALAGGELFLLQSRPITTLKDIADPSGERRIWDNSNIAESYGGVTTPLTFSFALNAYGQVYREFCRLMGVDAAVIDSHANTFDNMLGLIQGRIYYNLINWYRLLALLPGFTSNRKFMEQMMGVKEELPPEALPPRPSRREGVGMDEATSGDHRRDQMRLVRSVIGLISSHARLPADIGRFHERLDESLGGGTAERLTTMRLDELTGHYRDLEHQLLRRWDAPLVNDFFAMIYYGVLAKLCKNWCGDEAGSLQNDLLCGQGGMISAKPAKLVQEMARQASGDHELVDALCEAPLHTLRRLIAERPDFDALYQAYLDEFGDRCLSELKLESPTLHDDPLLLLRSVGQLAKERPPCPPILGEESAVNSLPITPDSSKTTAKKVDDLFTSNEPEVNDKKQAPDSSPRIGGKGAVATRGQSSLAPLPRGGVGEGASGDTAALAEQRVAEALKGQFLRRVVFGWVLKNARERLRNRENLRFERTRVFGRVRRVFVEIGKRLWEIDALDEPRDIFYLQVAEALAFVEGTASTVDLKRLVAARKPEFEAFAEAPAPPDRFETFGAVHAGNKFTATPRQNDYADIPEGDVRTGIPCCPGIVRAKVRIIRDPRSAALEPGEILVAERTDPGWIMLFAAAGGLLVERGSLLSHSAIVSREMGIPSIVSVSGVTTWLHDGDVVELNGAAGTARRISD